jgi:hypothetical protein
MIRLKVDDQDWQMRDLEITDHKHYGTILLELQRE